MGDAGMRKNLLKGGKMIKYIVISMLLVNCAFAQSPALIDLQTGKYLGNVNANRYDPNSVANPYGRYGSRYSPDSVNNPYGQYGSVYSPSSVNYPYSGGGYYDRDK